MNTQTTTIFNYQLSASDYLSAAGTGSKILSLSNIYLLVLVYAVVSNFLHAMHIIPDVAGGNISADQYWTNSFLYFLFTFLYLDNIPPRFNPFKRWAIVRTWRRTVQMQQPINLSITETGVDWKTQGYQDFRQWRYYNHVRESKEMFLLYYSESLYYILPKRAFSSPEKMDQLKDLLTKKNVECR
jgi:YcxB-like protein